jgi:hypothetical protein
MFYFYINFPNSRNHTIQIHSGDCGFCQNGNGMHDSTNSENGFWAGPFPNLQQAEVTLQRLINLFQNPPNIANHSCCN